MRFTIRSLMIAVVVVAILLAIPGGWGATVAVLSLPGLILTGARWLVLRGRRRLAAASFWTLGVLANTLYAACCIAPSVDVLRTLSLGSLFVVNPIITSLGWAWATLATRDGAVPRRPGPAVWLSVCILALLPVITLVSYWPLRVAFLTARPTMERLADQIAAGKVVAFPQQAGMFRVVKSAVGPVAGNVALMIDANPNGTTGFVRITPGVVAGAKLGAPIFGSDLDVGLGAGWWYRADD